MRKFKIVSEALENKEQVITANNILEARLWAGNTLGTKHKFEIIPL